MILLTRHKEENLFIKKKLLTENINSISEPITYVRHLSKKLQAENKKVFLVGSQQTLKTIKLKKNLKYLNKSIFFIIGKKSASHFKKLKLKVKLVGIDSIDLVSKIKKNKIYKDHKIEYLCSNINNSTLIADLKKTKKEIKKNILYEITPKKHFQKRTLNSLNHDKIKVVMLFSKFNSDTFLKICKHHKIQKKNLCKIHFITMSKRNSSKLIKLGMKVSWPTKPELLPMIKLAIKKYKSHV